VDPFPDPLLLRKSGSAWNRTRTSGSVPRNPDRGGQRPQRRSTSFCITYINSVRTSQKTQYISVLYSRTLTTRPQRQSSRSHITTNSQSASQSWCLAPIWNPRPILLSPFCSFVAPSLTRGLVCNLLVQLLLGLARAVTWVEVPQNSLPYFTVSSETPSTWRARFPNLYPPGTVWPSYTPGHWVPFLSPLTTRRTTVELF
jgi:hypothetical protein